MKKEEIGILHITDIHFGHKKNSALEIATNLKMLISDNYNTIKSTVRIIGLGGDEFDDALSVMSEDSAVILDFFMWLCNFAAKNNIIVRCIEGTNSHSYKQMKTIADAIAASEIKVDFKYIDNIAIEYIPSLNINVLYIPDEMNGNNASKTIKQVRTLLRKMNLKQVDIAFMHGAFNYQLPMVKLDSNHIEADYLEIVKHYIFIGHVHTHSVFIRIIATGSPDRLKHGEEEDKGIVLAIINLNDIKKDKYLFLVNKRAKTFNTYFLKDMTLEDINKRLSKEFKKLREGSYVRLAPSADNVFNKDVLTNLKKLYTHLIFTSDKVDNKKISIFDNKLSEKKIVNAFAITKDNIVPLILEVAVEKLNGADIEMLTKELKALL